MEAPHLLTVVSIRLSNLYSAFPTSDGQAQSSSKPFKKNTKYLVQAVGITTHGPKKICFQVPTKTTMREPDGLPEVGQRRVFHCKSAITELTPSLVPTTWASSGDGRTWRRPSLEDLNGRREGICLLPSESHRKNVAHNVDKMAP